MESRGTVLMQKYEIGRLLGKGTFAKVYYAKNISNGQSVAIKMIDKDKVMKVGLMEHVKREISVLSLVRHPNVVQLFEVMANKSKIYFVMEYAKGGELFGKVAKGKVPEDDARKHFQQLINAIDYCHSRGVYHRDLKPENLLLDENDNLKVSDFGLSALVDSKMQDNLLHTTCGTPAYVSPEVISRMGYDGAKADIWSCGVILFVLMAGYYPFHDSNLIDMYKKIAWGEFKCPTWFSSGARKLIKKILDPDPSTRISIEEIRENKWFKKGFGDRKVKEQKNNSFPLGVPAVSSSSDSNTEEEKQDSTKIVSLNAFHIISLSVGVDLSGLFPDNHQKKECWFTCRDSASTIISKLYNMAKRLKLKVTKKDGGLLKMETQKEGRYGNLAINFEIFEVSPSLYLVEMKRSAGDTLEYQKLVKEGIRPALEDIVWAWQCDWQYCPHQQY